MTLQVCFEVLAAGVGTMAFALLFHVPRQYYPACGLTGAAGWALYRVALLWLGTPEATFFATLLVVCLSRFFAIRMKCPVTVFLISGIFPLVPGAGIYWTAYYLVMDELGLAMDKGFVTLKIAVSIVLGIVLIFELPQRVFRWKKRGSGQGASKAGDAVRQEGRHKRRLL